MLAEIRDISLWNTIQDAQLLKQTITGLLIKVGQKNWEDVHFRQHVSTCRLNDISYGLWWFYHPDYPGDPQAIKFLELYGSLGTKHRVYLDCENIDYKLPDGSRVLINPRSKSEYTFFITTWLKDVEAATGLVPGVYTAFYFWQQWVHLSNAVYSYNGVNYTTPDWGRYDLWVANYDVQTPLIPHGWTTWKFWQYSAKVTPGIWNTDPAIDTTDADKFNGTPAEAVAYLNIEGGGVIVPPITKSTFVSSTKFLRSLNVPYISQLGTGADVYNNDCGAAAGAMLVQGYTDKKPTVDQFHQATGVTVDVYLSAYQIINALAYYEVPANWKISNLLTLLVDLNSGRPVICLISYGVLVDAKVTQNITFRGFHFIVAVGYDAENIYINDPLWKDAGGKEVAVPQGVFNRSWQQAGANPSLNPAFGCIVPTAVLGVPVTITSTIYKVIASQLNIRSAPNSNVPNIVGALYFGNQVQIESIDIEGWGKILGKTQYVYMSWLVKV